MRQIRLKNNFQNTSHWLNEIENFLLFSLQVNVTLTSVLENLSHFTAASSITLAQQQMEL